MSTTLQIRPVRLRTTFATVTWLLGTAIFSCAILSTPSGVAAQSQATTKSGVLSKSDAAAVSLSRHAALLNAYRANYSSEITRNDLDLFIDRSRLHANGFSSVSGLNNNLSKGASSMFEDMQLVPDQTLENSDSLRRAGSGCYLEHRSRHGLHRSRSQRSGFLRTAGSWTASAVPKE